MDKTELYNTAALARLELSEEEAGKLGQAVTQMLEYFESMAAVDISSLEPTTHALNQNNVLRDDRCQPVNNTEQLIDRAPEKSGRFIVIPNVL
ncbi:MAG: Asp-tRNA(Asn)/Glu-tRNA(Gln) amidotransferase subunit GatC [Spirochaetales bacterium]|nr:Asp-tRNA(Asn)/Glu-tRNA(Gln) amidotransferase subunit GatC [Spirochaetales bacterium]